MLGVSNGVLCPSNEIASTFEINTGNLTTNQGKSG